MHKRDTAKYGIEFNCIKTDSNALCGPSWGNGRGGDSGRVNGGCLADTTTAKALSEGGGGEGGGSRQFLLKP